MPLKLKSSKGRINTGLLVPIVLVLSLLLILFLIFNCIHVFSGNRAEAIEMLGIIAQGSAALTAIVFAFLTYISQTIIGKYVSGTIKYLYKHRNFVILIVFYSSATITNAVIMWIFPKLQLNLLVDVSSSLLLLEIIMLPLLFFVQSKLLNPETIIDTLLGKPDLKNTQTIENTMENVKVVFDMVYKLAENKEYDGATHGLKKISEIITSRNEVNPIGMYQWGIPNYERIGVECFIYDPNISAFVMSQFNEMIDHLTDKTPHDLFVASSMIATACFKIAKAVAEKSYCEDTLMRSYFLLQKIYVAQSLVDYDAFATDELDKIVQIVKMAIKANVQPVLMISAIEESCMRLVGKKNRMMQLLFAFTLEVFPKDDRTLQDFVVIIFCVVPTIEKESADYLIEMIKMKFGHLEIEFSKTDQPSRTEIGVRNGVVTVKSGNKEIAEKVKWFKEKMVH